MEKNKTYPRVLFSRSAIEEAFKELRGLVDDDPAIEFRMLSVTRGNESWYHDTFEEFLADFGGGLRSAVFDARNSQLSVSVKISNFGADPLIYSETSIEGKDRSKIQRLSNVFDNYSESCKIPEPETDPSPKPKIFIGHGQSPLWRDLKDHLTDLHGYEVVSYETGARAGHSIRDVITELLDESSFAILVMTAEDELPDGSLRARQNVIHEIGLFQGRLGFTKAVALKEDGAEEFSNIHGVQQIRFSQGNIRETFGDVLATLRREFGKNSS
jgi:predicted nucleotide-binding protein